MKKIKNKYQSLVYKIIYLRLKLFHPNIEISKNAKVDCKTKIQIDSNKLIIGDNVYLRSKSKGYHAGMPFATTILLDMKGAYCEIGDNTRINGCYIHAKKKIIIGANTVIASGTHILDSNGHQVLSINRTLIRDTPKEIQIGNNVWVGLNCIILKGTVIGNNSIVAAGSVVKGNFPANSLIQGNPAHLVKLLDITE